MTHSTNSTDLRLRAAIDAAPSGILMTDASGRIVLANRRIESLFGYAQEDLLGRPIEMLEPERLRLDQAELRASVLRDPHARAQGLPREFQGLRQDGVEVPLEISLTPVVTEEGLFLLSAIVDISSRKRAEDDHRRLEDQLRAAQKMEAIGRLASGIAHDFNNVLMGILGCGELLKHGLPAGHAVLPIVDDMCSAAQRGASLSRDLLDFSRRKPVDVVRASLNSVVRVAERMLRQMIGEDIALHIELCPSGGSILGNPAHLEDILLNLVIHAREAMPNGGQLRIVTRDIELVGTLSTRSRPLHPGDYVMLEVEDSGLGMDAATCERMFEPFSSKRESGRGTGLGLFTVYSIVHQLQGGIAVDSQPGLGTVFRIYLPRLADLGLEGLRGSTAPSPADKAGNARILVVEDDRTIRTAMRLLLARMDYQVLVAEDAASALAAARGFEGRIDLLLSDMVLPDTSGSEVAKVLTRERPDLKVLFMSAYPADLLVHQRRILPGTVTLEKPFDELTLARAVRTALLAPGTSESPVA